MRARRLNSRAGLTLVEVVVSATLTAGVLLAAGRLLDTSNSVAQSTTDAGTASRRASVPLTEMADFLRRASTATIEHLDGTTFASGTSDTGIRLRLVTDYAGAPILSQPITFRWDGATKELLRTDGAVDTVMARNITNFSVSRSSGHLFTFTATAHSGPSDDRGRTATANLQMAARNP